jgi:hypothetical protein
MTSPLLRAIIITGALPGLSSCDRTPPPSPAPQPAAASSSAAPAPTPPTPPPDAPPIVVGSITFEKPRLSITAAHSESQVRGSFPFKITGPSTVRITDIRAYCSCLSVNTNDGRREYQPGQSGTIDAVFDLGSFEGEIEKSIGVTTDSSPAGETQLTLAVTIPLLYEAVPPTLKWSVGDAPDPKEIRIRILGDQPIRITNTVSSRDQMLASAREVTPGREYIITLTPQSTAEPMLGMLRVETDAPWERYRKKLLFFNVARPQPATPATPP